MASLIKTMKRKDKFFAAFTSILLVVFLGGQVAILSKPKAVQKVENQIESLYTASIPPLPAAAEGSISINTADVSSLMTLPHIGQTLAERIIAYREANGAFPHPACIMEVSGIGEKTYEEIRDKIKVTD